MRVERNVRETLHEGYVAAQREFKERERTSLSSVSFPLRQPCYPFVRIWENASWLHNMRIIT